MRYFVTGNHGFIGKALCEHVGSDNVCGYDIKNSILDNVSYGKHLNKRLDDYQPDVVVHLAAMSGINECLDDPGRAFDTNVLGTFSVIENARLLSIKRIVLASSCAVKNCLTPYHVHKRFTEDYCLASFLSYGVNSCALRFTNVYGVGSVDKNSVIAVFFKEAITKGTITINGTGEQTRDFIHISDVVNAIEKASFSKFQGVLSISSGTSTSINTIAKMIANLTHAKILYRTSRINDVQEVKVNNEVAKEILGWEPIENMKTEFITLYQYYLDNVDTLLLKDKE